MTLFLIIVAVVVLGVGLWLLLGRKKGGPTPPRVPPERPPAPPPPPPPPPQMPGM